MDWSRIPLRPRLALGAAVMMLLATTAFGAFAYKTTRDSALQAAATRVRTSAFNFANRSSVGLLEVLRSVTEAARDSAVVATLRTGVPSPATTSALQRVGFDTVQTFAVGLRDPSGRVVMALRASPPAWAIDPRPRRDSSRIGRMVARSDTILFEFTAPVLDRKVLLGEVVMTRRVRPSATTAETVAVLMGEGGVMLFGNQDGSLWTDLATLVAGPSSLATSQYRRDGLDRIAAVHAIPATPFVFAVEFPKAQVLAPVHALLWRFVLIAALISGIGLLAGWTFSARIAKPLTEFTAAAEELAAGRAPVRRLAVEHRGDELGRLGRAFGDMAESVHQARENLEQKVADRTRALEEAQEALVRRERLAVLGQLAGSIGHELRNPLGVMSNAIHVLNATLGNIPPMSREALALLREQVTLADKIVTDILDWARMKAPQLTEVTVAEFVEEQVRRLTVPHGIQLEVDVAPNLPPVHVDPVQIGQVLVNLVTNGVQAMEGGRGVLTVRARHERGRLRLEVQDQGPGVPEEHLSRIFEPLFSTKPRGVGLGLAISRSLAQAHGGDLTVAKATEGGAVFILELPAKRSA